MSKKEIRGGTFSRSMTFKRADADDEARVIPVSISSETPVRRFFGDEILRHEKKAVDMTRAGQEHGLPLRIDHGGRVIGRVKNIRLEKRRLVGDAHFSDNTELAREAYADARDGILTDTSIMYDIFDYDGEPRFSDENADNTVEITRWMPTEAALVGVPADPNVGAFRSKTVKTGDQMSDKDGKKPTQDKRGDSLTLDDFTAARAKARGEGFQEGQRAEAERTGKIIAHFEPYMQRSGVAELRQACIDEQTSAERSNELLLEFLAGDPDPVRSDREQSKGGHAPKHDIETVREAGEKWIEGAQEWLEFRGGMVAPDKRRDAQASLAKNEFAGMRLDEIARDYMVRSGASTRSFNRLSLVGQAFIRAGMHGTSDFANLLENVANKAMMMGYEESMETWRMIARVGNIADFKAASRLNISTFSDLQQVLENDEFEAGGFSDLKETIQLSTYGRLFPISRQAIINDDIDAFTRIPMAMGRAAHRKVGDVVWAVLTANAALAQDATALFHADHSNLAGSGGAISETTLDAGRNAMQTQTAPSPNTALGESGATLNIAPRLLLVPSAKQMTAVKAVRTPTGPDTTGDLTVNTFANRLDVVSEARLDADSTTAWYLSADPNQVDTIEVAFLDGNQEPFLDSQNGWTIDGVEYKVRHDVAAAALDFRGLYKNPGA